MEQIVLRKRLREGALAEYEKVHARIPQGVADDLLARGVHEWVIYRDGLDLIHVVDVEDYAAFVVGEPMNDAAAGWLAIVAPYLESTDGVQAEVLWKLSRNEN